MPGTVVSDGPTVSLSFANNFWGKEDAGVSPLIERMHNAKITGDELKAFYTARAQIEEEYSRKMLNLARKPLGSSEAGTLRMSLDVLRGELESMGKEHQNIAGKMKSELEEPLVAFAGGLKERRKIVQNGIEKLLKVKTQQTGVVNKARDKFEQDCLKIKGYLAQGHMVMGQEERKNKAKLEKTQIQMSANSNEYEAAVKVLEETTGKWNREWKAACDKFQDLEEERLDYFKSSLWNFANIASTVCVSDDGSCEKIRLSLEDCDVEKDITSFINEVGTGQEIPDPPKYINFCRGDVDDAMSKAGSDDGDYSVAQFQRTMNPTFRSSSPQPSTYDSHHDPDTSLRDDMGLSKSRSSLQGDESFNTMARSSHGSGAPFNVIARSSHGSAAPPPLAPSQSSVQHDPYANAPQVPHNPFPADGMTQFCRLGPPSERSSIPSPTRRESRDSQEHSDYSAPTSLSSFEPASGNASPTKQYNGSGMSQYNGSALSATSPGADDLQSQKKKSSFFQSHSPFRRKSNKSKEPTQPMSHPQPMSQPQPTSVMPSTRNTWTPATVRNTESANTSPTKPFVAANKANTWQKQPSPSPEPDAVDPRADYQLGIGGNVFDVASPDKRNKVPARKDVQSDLDPIAQALAELKGVTKHTSVRQSADRHYGMATPASHTPTFDGRGLPAGAVPTPFAASSNRATPPPAYDSAPVSRLGAPQPAHTRKEMQKSTERFVNQKRDMFNSGAPPGRPGSSMGRGQPVPRAASPQPLRTASPQPDRAPSPRPYQQQSQQQSYGGVSPNSYQNQQAPRPRAQSTSPIKPQSNYGGYNSHGGSPNHQAPRAVSPNPAYNNRPQQAAPMNRGASPNPAYGRPHPSGSMQGGGLRSRPSSSRGSEHAGGAMVLAPAGAQDPYVTQGRPQSQYYGGPQDSGRGTQQVASRDRSQSQSTQRQMTKDGRPILHYARALYMYAAAIPEELSFGKGEVLAVLRHQDDGWWEAEVCGKSGQAGLVPSNYLKAC